MENNNTFTVTPMSQLIELTPGETYTGSINIINPSNATSDFDYKVYVAPYSVVSEEYNVDVATETDWNKMVDWISIENPKGSLTPNDVVQINYTIQVPSDAPGGGQYASIIVGIDNESEADGNMTVTNVMEIASVIYAKVDGEINHSGEILENNVPVFSAIAPVTVSALIKNDGNMHEQAEVSITIKDFFTGEEILPTETDDGIHTEIIMPETTKYVSRELDGLPLIGVVTIKQNVYYNYQFSSVEKNVLICPIWFIVLVLLTIGAIIFGIVKVIRRHRHKRKKDKAVAM